MLLFLLIVSVLCDPECVYVQNSTLTVWLASFNDQNVSKCVMVVSGPSFVNYSVYGDKCEELVHDTGGCHKTMNVCNVHIDHSLIVIFIMFLIFFMTFITLGVSEKGDEYLVDVGVVFMAVSVGMWYIETIASK